jgi:uncharacterized membrane-anchored protein
MSNVADYVTDAILLVIGAYVLFSLVQSFSQSNPSFGQYGWSLLSAFVVGAVWYLKHRLKA